jgi:hypothetical protein
MSKTVKKVVKNTANTAASKTVSKAVNKASSTTVGKIKNTFFPQVDTDTSGWLIVDGKEYEINHFSFEVRQWVDHKGQPQSEVRGSQITVTLTQTVPENIYHWAMRTQAKNGEVVFKSKTASAPLKIQFTDGYCTDLVRTVNSAL